MNIPNYLNQALEQFVVDLSHEDQMGVVIRAHLRVENMLLAIIEKLLPYPERHKNLHLDFDGNVALSLALGLNERFGAPLKALGKLRNDFAHKCDFQLSRSSVNNLYSCLSRQDKAQVHEIFARVKSLNEETKNVEKFSNLEPIDRFRLMAVSLWALMQAALRVKLLDGSGNA